jgi:hypothetical protein
MLRKTTPTKINYKDLFPSDIPSCAEFAGLFQESDSAAPESVTKLGTSLNGAVVETI